MTSQPIDEFDRSRREIFAGLPGRCANACQRARRPGERRSGPVGPARSPDGRALVGDHERLESRVALDPGDAVDAHHEHGGRVGVGDPEIAAEHAGPIVELIVIEARQCPMCRLFRDEIAPAYRATARAERAPLRFVDVAHTDPATHNLAAPVEIIPTVVLMRDGIEIDRVVGYTGPEIFMRAVGVMLGEQP